MLQSRTWRELLGQLVETPAEKQRVADALGIRTWTLTRWVNDLVDPRLRYLKRVPELFPSHREQLIELIAAEFPDIFSEAMALREDMTAIPFDFYARLLAAYAHTDSSLASWSISHLGLLQALTQLDPERLGLEIILLQCTPPVAGQPVRTLCERAGIGAHAQERGVGWHVAFRGAESFAGYAISYGRPAVIQDLSIDPGLFISLDGTEKSIAAYLLQRRGQIAGCLLVTSPQLDYFSQARCDLVNQYANLLALAFSDEDFYPPNRIVLHKLAWHVARQQDTNMQFPALVMKVLQEAHPGTLLQADAERMVLHKLEADLLAELDSLHT
jgi:hypothetical protein